MCENCGGPDVPCRLQPEVNPVRDAFDGRVNRPTRTDRLLSSEVDYNLWCTLYERDDELHRRLFMSRVFRKVNDHQPVQENP